MHRSLFRCVRVYLSQNNSFKQCHRSLITNDPDDVSEIPLYHETQHRRLSKARFLDFLTTKLLCPPQRANQICTNYPKFSERTLQEVRKNVNFLTLRGVTQALILDNPWMLTFNHVHLSSNIHILEEMKPKNINDFAPLAIVPSKKLIKIKEIAEEEANIIPSTHRIYYFSELLDVNPCTVSKYVSDHPFVLEMPFNKLDSRMKSMLKFINPDGIVNNLGSLKSCTSQIESRLAQAKESNLSMKAIRVHQSQYTFCNLIKKSNEKKAILGERTLVQYYSDRLNHNIETIEVMLIRCPSLRKYNVKIIEEKLDYLLNEAGIPAIDIVRTPYVLVQSLETIKERVIELQSLGCHNHIYLKYVVKNAKQYNEHLENLKKSTETQAMNKE